MARDKFGKSRGLAQHLASGHDELSECPDFPRRLKAVSQVFGSRSCWSRIWIIQEFTNAARGLILCGKRCMDLDMLTLIKLASSKLIAAGPGHLFENGGKESASSLWKALRYLHNFQYSIDRLQERSQREPLAENLLMYTGRGCTDLRDKIYALLAISQPIDLSIDYCKSVAEVWIDTTRSIIAHERSLNIICLLPYKSDWKEVRREPSKEFPSWVPRYKKYLFARELWESGEPTENQRYVGGGAIPPSNNVHIEDSRVLQIQGYSIGRIKEAGRNIAFGDWKDINFSAILEFLKCDVPPADSNSFWRSLVMDVYFGDDQLERRIGDSDESQVNFASDIAEALASTPPVRLLERLEYTLDDKALCRTTNGEFALVHGDPEVGDYIFIARGATFPFIIRPTKRDKPYRSIKKAFQIQTFYQYVGGAYVHGKMDGEPLREMEAEGREEETVFLI
jgi:hypothetical protein